MGPKLWYDAAHSDSYIGRESPAKMEAIRSDGHTGIPKLILAGILILVVVITGGVLEDAPAILTNIVKSIAYIATILVIAVLSLPLRWDLRIHLAKFWNSYRNTILIPLLLYFTGLLIGALRGPQPARSLWQTFSDMVVFCFALVGFGWLNTCLDSSVEILLKTISILAGVLLLISLVMFLGNVAGLWAINIFVAYVAGNRILMNGPFNHANVLGYVLMTGCLSCITLALRRHGTSSRRWWSMAGVMAIGVMATVARGAILGTIGGALIAVISRRRELLRIVVPSAAALSLLLVFVYSRGTLPWFVLTSSATRLPREEFTGYQGLDHEAWVEKLQQDNGQIVLHSNGTITSNPIQLDPQSYQIIVDGYGTKGQANPEDSLRTPIVTLSVLRGGEKIFQKSFQLADKRSYHLVSDFSLPSHQEVRVQLSFSDDAFLGPGNDRSVFISDIYIARSWVPIIDWSTVDYLPKVGSSGRWKMWRAAMENLRNYGLWGVGAGNAESWPGWSTHNVFLEQYGEGGILTLFGFLAWLALPILHVNRSRLPRDLAMSIIAMMVGLIIHGLFWTQFLDGLRFLTLVYVSLWTALATQRPEAAPNQILPNQ